MISSAIARPGFDVLDLAVELPLSEGEAVGPVLIDADAAAGPSCSASRVSWAAALTAVLVLSGCGLSPSNQVLPVDPPATGPAASATAGLAPIDVGAGRAGTVTRVVDGDTVEVTADGGGEVTVRVLGIDTPETKDPRRPVQCWGPQASQFATDTLLDRPVRLVGDPTQASRDRYGRLLAYVYLPDGSNFSVLAAAAGAARAYVYDTPDTAHPMIVAAQDDARAAGRGLWGACGG